MMPRANRRGPDTPWRSSKERVEGVSAGGKPDSVGEDLSGGPIRPMPEGIGARLLGLGDSLDGRSRQVGRRKKLVG